MQADLVLGSIELDMKIQENMEVELVAQKDFCILSISIYKVLQLDDENRNMDMKLFLEETLANYQKLIVKIQMLWRRKLRTS